MTSIKQKQVIVIGGGFSGLAASYEIASSGIKVTLIEKDSELGGIAGTFEVLPGIRLEKFYHHWFGSDQYIFSWLKELGLADSVIHLSTKTTFKSSRSNYKLSTPLDLLRFKSLPLFDRLRTGWLIVLARLIKNWKQLDRWTAKEWIIQNAGIKSYEVIWKPLLLGKFGKFAEEVSAVWMWSRLTQRGASRDKAGQETLSYFKGGFAPLIKGIEEALINLGVTIVKGSAVDEICIENNAVTGVRCQGTRYDASTVLCTTPLPIFIRLTKGLSEDLIATYSDILFVSNICLILRLKECLSDAYWTNIADEEFPFVVAIEHTNFDDIANYGGNHLVYFSSYLDENSELYRMEDNLLVEHLLPKIKKLYPDFNKESLLQAYVWREPYSQPVNTKNYLKHVPPNKLPVKGLWLATMAQVFPEGRSTNVIVGKARQVAKSIVEDVSKDIHL